MYLHLGRDTVVNTDDIIAIMDLESSSMSANTRTFLKLATDEGFVKNVSEEIPRTFVVCEIDGQSVVYVTNISSKALSGRAERYNS